MSYEYDEYDDVLDDGDEIDILEDFRERHGYEWPNCATPDCENKTCVPSKYCHPCTVRITGIDPRADR